MATGGACIATPAGVTLARTPRLWLSALVPETWRADLLRIVLRVAVVLGSVVYVPSAFLAMSHGMIGVVVLDTVTIVGVLVLTYVVRIPEWLRAACTCLVLYVLGAGLMVGVGAISQTFLLAFSLLTTLLVRFRWALASVALNSITMLAIGFLGVAAPEMGVAGWRWSYAAWSVIVSNFVLVNGALVLVLGAVITALESAVRRSAGTLEALERERRELVKVNESLGQEVRERARTEESLRESRALLRIAGLTARLGGWRIALGGSQLVWSDEVCVMFGLPVGTTPTMNEALALFAPRWRDTVTETIQRCSVDGTPFDLEAEIVTANGAGRWVRTIGNALRDADGAISHVHGSVQDITQQKLTEARQEKLEEQLRQAQKMDTIGGLAAGIAHDFNNLMSIVLSYTELALLDLKQDDPLRADLAQVHAAGNRAVALTRQLLAFGRQQVLAPKVVDLARIVVGMENMLRRLIGEDIDLATSGVPGLGDVLVDPGQLEQVIMNLAVNARDAMPRGGMLTIETRRVTLDEHYAAEHEGVSAGAHVMLAVSDTGTGMDKATHARMFEPFFTTKEVGRGTGLGLATVFGIVRQSGGTIWVYSEPGKGTSFKVYFPLASSGAPTLDVAERPSAPRGAETILLVEDDEQVRVLTRSILRLYGYNVLEACNGGEAFLVCEQHPATIHLLLTDVVMPRMSGRQLAERVRPIRPGMKVLYMSGHTDDAVVRHGILESTIAFIQKPITPEELARSVRRVLDAA